MQASQNASPDLVLRAQQGDAEALLQVWETFSVQIFRRIYRMVGDRHTADDLRQDVLVRFLRHHANLDPETVRNWLMRVASNIVIDYLKSKNTHTLLLGDERGPNESGTAGSIPDIASAIVDGHVVRLWLSELHMIYPRYAQIIVERHIYGASIDELAKKYELNPPALSALLFRAMAKLREIAIRS